jgi:hypothetical protein
VSGDQREPKLQAISCMHRTYQIEHNFILIAKTMKLKDVLSYMMLCNAVMIKKPKKKTKQQGKTKTSVQQLKVFLL